MNTALAMKKSSQMDPSESDGTFTNVSGFDIRPLYGPEDVAGFDYKADLGLPGEYPFVRGVHRTMYRGRPWTIRQLGSLSSPEMANQRIRQLIAMGATGVHLLGYADNHG